MGPQAVAGPPAHPQRHDQQIDDEEQVGPDQDAVGQRQPKGQQGGGEATAKAP